MNGGIPEMSETDKARMKRCEEEFQRLLAKYGAVLLFQRIDTMGPAGQQTEMNIYFVPDRAVKIVDGKGAG